MRDLLDAEGGPLVKIVAQIDTPGVVLGASRQTALLSAFACRVHSRVMPLVLTTLPARTSPFNRRAAQL